MLQPLDGPSKSDNLNATTATAVEVKKDVSAFEARKVLTLEPDGKIFVYFADEGETPTAGDVTASGFTHGKNVIRSYEASHSQAIWVVANAGTVNVRFSERG